MRKHILRLFVSIIMIVSLMITGCSAKTINVDDRITLDNINKSAVNASEGFIQAVFTSDEELFYRTFPDGFLDSVIEEGNDPFTLYTDSVSPDLNFYGIAMSGTNDFTEENGYDSNWMRENIVQVHGVDAEAISEIVLVKLRVYFSGAESDEYEASDVYVLAYKMDSSWYVFEMANSDADFKA